MKQNETRTSLCPLCKTGEVVLLSQSCKDYISGDSFAVLSCEICHCCFTRTFSTNHHGRNHYGEDYYNSQTGKFSPFFEKLFRLNHRRNAAFLKNNFSTKTILEVGCGRGYLLKELKRSGAAVYCLESADAADWILSNQDVNVIPLAGENENCWPFDPEFFHLIIYWHTLEHLSDPLESLEQATRCLSPGGTLCISVPNITSLQAQLHLPTWFHLDVPRHVFHFSQSGLVSLLKRHGYTITKVRSGDRMQNLFGWMQSIANIFTPNSTNSFYRLLQGGKPLLSVDKRALLVQILTAWIWIPLGILGLLCEEIIGEYGTITIYAKKDSTIDNKHEMVQDAS